MVEDLYEKMLKDDNLRFEDFEADSLLKDLESKHAEDSFKVPPEFEGELEEDFDDVEIDDSAIEDFI